MKSSYLFTFFALIGMAALLSTGCDSGDKSVRDSARQSLGVNNQPEQPGIPPPPASAMNTSAPAGSGVQHYICPNNCEGSGAGQAGTCPVCGTEYVHNQAFHDQAPAQQQQTQTMSFPGSTDGSQTPPPPPTTPEPAQNAAGVWHYTCANGCEGGAGSAGTCAKCGGSLQHNAAYHQ